MSDSEAQCDCELDSPGTMSEHPVEFRLECWTGWALYLKKRIECYYRLRIAALEAEIERLQSLLALEQGASLAVAVYKAEVERLRGMLPAREPLPGEVDAYMQAEYAKYREGSVLTDTDAARAYQEFAKACFMGRGEHQLKLKADAAIFAQKREIDRLNRVLELLALNAADYAAQYGDGATPQAWIDEATRQLPAREESGDE